MARSPAEEEGEDAGTVPSSWPRRPRYNVGDEVEVLFTGKGFRGARYEATVTARLSDSARYDYEVVYSKVLAPRGDAPLRELVAASDVRPPPPPAGHAIELFDLVEAYTSEGWWPGVVSDIRPKRRRTQETRFSVSLPLFRVVVKLSASLVRPRREFVYGSWMEAQEVLRGIPQYAEGSHIEVMCDKQGRVWRPAIIKKMIGITSYVVSYGNGDSSIEVLHAQFIRPKHTPDKMELEPSTEVEVYQAEATQAGRVKVKGHDNKYGDDHMIVSSVCLRPKDKLDNQEWRLHSTKDYVKERKISDSDYPPEFSMPAANSNQYSSIPNKRLKIENAQMEEQHLRYSLNLRQDTAASCDGKGTHSLPKALATKKGLLYGSSLDIIEIGSNSNSNVIAHSEDSCHRSVIYISDSSNTNINRRKRRMELPDEELNSNHLICSNQVPSSSGQKGVKADLVCIEALGDNKMEIKNDRTGMSLVEAEDVHVETCMNCKPCKITKVFFFGCIDTQCTVGQMSDFANLAESIKRMHIQDEPRLYDEKMSSLMDLEDRFQVGPLKSRLHDLLCTRYRHINLKNRKARLEKEILEIEALNCGLEQRLKFLDMCIMGMEKKKYQEMKASLEMQKKENYSSISKLQVDLCQVEESLLSAEANFNSIATAPWQSDVGPLLP